MILRIHASLPLHAAALVLAATFSAACPVHSPGATDAGTDPGTTGSADGSTTGSPTTTGMTMTSAADTAASGPSFATDVQPILDGACVTGCHAPGGTGAPWGDFTAGSAYTKWLGPDEMGAASLESQALKLVDPGDREASYVWHKVNNTHLGPPANGSLDPMPPPSSGMMLADADRETIGLWIDGGANP